MCRIHSQVCSSFIPYICIFKDLYICIFVYLYICILFICLFVYLFICLFVYLFICLFVHLFICSFVHLFICSYFVVLKLICCNRYGKVHAVQSKIEWLKANEPKGIPDVPMTILTPAVPDECIRYSPPPSVFSRLSLFDSRFSTLAFRFSIFASRFLPLPLPLSSLSPPSSFLLLPALPSPTATDTNEQIRCKRSEGPHRKLQGLLRICKTVLCQVDKT